MPYCCFSSSLHTLEFRNGSSSVSGAFVVVVVGYQYTIGGGSSTTSSNSSSTSGFNRASVIHPMVAEGITSVKGQYLFEERHVFERGSNRIVHGQVWTGAQTTSKPSPTTGKR